MEISQNIHGVETASASIKEYNGTCWVEISLGGFDCIALHARDEAHARRIAAGLAMAHQWCDTPPADA